MAGDSPLSWLFLGLLLLSVVAFVAFLLVLRKRHVPQPLAPAPAPPAPAPPPAEGTPPPPPTDAPKEG